jgi:hypothetical protein
LKTILRIFLGGHFIISMLFIVCGLALIGLGALQLWEGVNFGREISSTQRLNAVLECIALLTVAVAALELGQTLLEEEVQREAHMSAPTRVRRFLSRFMVVLVVSLSIETLVLVFRIGRATPEHLPYAAAIGMMTAFLLAGWGIFIRFNRSAEELEPEAMADAKREDKKLAAGGTK